MEFAVGRLGGWAVGRLGGWAVGFRTRDNPSGCEDMDKIISIPISIEMRSDLQENSAWIYKFLFLGGVMTFRIGA